MRRHAGAGEKPQQQAFPAGVVDGSLRSVRRVCTVYTLYAHLPRPAQRSLAASGQVHAAHTCSGRRLHHAKSSGCGSPSREAMSSSVGCRAPAMRRFTNPRQNKMRFSAALASPTSVCGRIGAVGQSRVSDRVSGHRGPVSLRPRRVSLWGSSCVVGARRRVPRHAVLRCEKSVVCLYTWAVSRPTGEPQLLRILLRARIQQRKTHEQKSPPQTGNNLRSRLVNCTIRPRKGQDAQRATNRITLQLGRTRDLPSQLPFPLPMLFPKGSR